MDLQFIFIVLPFELSDVTTYSLRILCLGLVFGQPKACTSSREFSFSTSHSSMSTSSHVLSA